MNTKEQKENSSGVQYPSWASQLKMLIKSQHNVVQMSNRTTPGSVVFRVMGELNLYGKKGVRPNNLLRISQLLSSHSLYLEINHSPSSRYIYFTVKPIVEDEGGKV